MKRRCGKHDPFIAVGMARDSSGKLKLRWSNDPGKCHMIYKARGETDIIMAELSEGLSKKDGVLFLKHRAHQFNNPEAMKVIDDYLEKNS